MPETSEYEDAKDDLVDAVVRFLEAGEAEGKSQAELMSEFLAAFASAAQEITA